VQPVAIPLFAQRLSRTGLPVQVSLDNSRALMPGTEIHPGQNPDSLNKNLQPFSLLKSNGVVTCPTDALD